MYLNIGKGSLIRSDNIIGIFDLDNTTQSAITRKYLTDSEKQGIVVNVAEDIPKSFIVYESINERILYLSQMAPATLFKRSEHSIF